MMASSKAKKPRLLQKFKDDYSLKYPGVIKKSLIDKSHAYRTLCNVDFGICHGGVNEVERHVKSDKHVKLAEARSCKSISNFLSPSTSSNDNNIIKAEVLFTEIWEHNIPICASDHAGKILKNMFPDSKIAEKYGCGRTKTTAIIYCMGQTVVNKVVELIKYNPLSLSTDASNNYDDIKLFPICVGLVNETGHV